MPRTEFTTSSDQSVKRWSPFLTQVMNKRTWARRFISDDDRGIIHRHRDLEAAAGDQIKYDQLVQLGETAVLGRDRAKGQEEAMTFYQDALGIDQMRKPVGYDVMSQQRTLHQLRRRAVNLLGDWWARKLDKHVFAQLCGTVGDDTAIETGFGGNALTVPSGDYLMDKTGSGVFVTAYIRQAKERAQNLPEPIQPIRTSNGEDVFVLGMSPYQVTSLKVEAGASKYTEMQVRARERSRTNPVFTGALGMIENVVLHEIPYLPSTTTTTRHAIFMGVGACHIGFGNPTRGSRGVPESLFDIVEDEDDFQDKLGLAARSIWGVKGSVYNSKPYGRIRIDTIDAAS